MLRDLRRSAVRNLERAGISCSIAMKLTGHKTEAVYRRYAIVAESDFREADTKLAAVLGTAAASPSLIPIRDIEIVGRVSSGRTRIDPPSPNGGSVTGGNMHPALELLKSFAECEEFARAMQPHNPELATQARRRAVELRADSHGARNVVEKQLLQAVYAYEATLSAKRGRRTRASRTWQMIERHGIVEAAERAVDRTKETSGYTALVEIGLQDFAFEAVILRHPDSFSPAAVARSKERLAVHDGP
jgi:hypothetical protein